MTDPDDLGRFAYAAYQEATGGRNFLGEPMPAWDQLPETIRQAWQTTAAAVVCDLRDSLSGKTAAAYHAERRSLMTIRKALDALPARCHYHGENVDPGPRDHLYVREACCDTGLPTRLRKLAEEALQVLTRSLGV